MSDHHDLDLGHTSNLGLKLTHLIRPMDTDIQGLTHSTTDMFSLPSIYHDPMFIFSHKHTFVKLNVSVNAISKVAFSCKMDYKLEYCFQLAFCCELAFVFPIKWLCSYQVA